MKLRFALMAALLAVFLIAPALAETDKTFYTEPMILKDDSGVQIEFISMVASDHSDASYYPYTYSPSAYRFYKVTYVEANPTDHDIRYQFRLNMIDSNGTVYTTDDQVLGYGIGAGRRVPYSKEFPIPRNATGLYLRWYHINTYLNTEETTDIQLVPGETATATPTGTTAPTATAVPSPTAMPTPTPKPTGLFEPWLPLGALMAAGILGIYARRRL